MRKWRTHACGVAVMLTFVAGGCGDDESGDSGSGSGSGSTAGRGSSGFDNPGVIDVAGGGGEGGTGAGAAGMGSGLPPDTCADGLVVAKRVTPRVILVLDGSCSMTTDYPANGKQSSTQCRNNENGRWAALRRALIDPAQGVVPKLQSVVQFGIAVYGTQPSCPLPTEPVSPALNNLAMIQERIPMVQPGMYTPTGPALDWVYENMVEEDGPDKDLAPQVVILATDGEPNSCGSGGGMVMTNYQPSIDAVKKGTAKGATTYVISLADATGPFHDHLLELANLGNPAAEGKARLYEPSSPEQLAATLQSLIGAAVSCDIELNGSVDPLYACTGTVTLDGKALGCNESNGWKLLDEKHIRLQGTACEALMTRTDANVQAKFSCVAFRPE